MRTFLLLLVLLVLPAVLVAVLIIRAADIEAEPVRVVTTPTTTPDLDALFPVTTTTTVKPRVIATQRTQPRTTAPIARAAAVAGAVPDLIRAGFARFGAVVAEQAVRVASCETGRTFNPAARNGAHAGLFQISGTYHRPRVARLGFTWQQMYEAQPNIAVAADLYGESNSWRAWSCKP